MTPLAEVDAVEMYLSFSWFEQRLLGRHVDGQWFARWVAAAISSPRWLGPFGRVAGADRWLPRR